MKTIEKIVVFLCAYLFCGWGTLFVQNANANSSAQNLRVFAYDLNYTFEPENGETQLGTYDVKYIFHICEAKAFLIGAVTGGVWDDSADAWALTAPADATGVWESPAFAGG